MFEKNMRIAYLLDFYGDVLDEHSKAIMKAYYEDDLSLSEIATGEGISRQGVRHIIKKCEEQLDFLENKLGLAAQFVEIEQTAESLLKISRQLSEHSDSSLLLYAEEIESAVNKILNKNA